MKNTKITKYFLNVGKFSFSSSLPFEQMVFCNESDLLNYAMNESEDFGETIAVFDSLESAKKQLDKMRCRVDSVACGIGYEHDCEIPYIEQVTCDSYAKDCIQECDYDIVDTVLVAKIPEELKKNRAEEIAEELKYSRRWDMELAFELCQLANMGDEFKIAVDSDEYNEDEEMYSFEVVTFAAAEKLGVYIL